MVPQTEKIWERPGRTIKAVTRDAPGYAGHLKTRKVTISHLQCMARNFKSLKTISLTLHLQFAVTTARKQSPTRDSLTPCFSFKIFLTSRIACSSDSVQTIGLKSFVILSNFQATLFGGYFSKKIKQNRDIAPSPSLGKIWPCSGLGVAATHEKL